MAQEIEANQEHLLQARKMAALGTFTAGIAHELNNPINNVYLTAQTYLTGFRLKDCRNGGVGIPARHFALQGFLS